MLWQFVLESETLIKHRLWKNSPLWRGNGRNFHKSDDIRVAHHAPKKGNVAQSCQSAQSITHRGAPKRRSQIILWRERKAHAGSVVTDSLRVVGWGRLPSKWGCKCFVCHRCVCHRGRLCIRGFSAALVTLTTSKLLESNQTEAFLHVHFVPHASFHNPVHNKIPFLMSNLSVLPANDAQRWRRVSLYCSSMWLTLIQYT